MKNIIKSKHLHLICSATIILIVLNGFLEWNSNLIVIVLTLTSILANIFWITFIADDSGYRKTFYGRFSYIFLSVLIFGFLFKLQHWSFAGTTYMIGYSGIMTIYFLRFVTKPKKNLLDILKLLWVETTALISLLILMHRIDRDYSIINGILFIGLICAFTLDYNKRMKLRK